MATQDQELRKAMLKLLFEQGWRSQRFAILTGVIIVAGLWQIAPAGRLVAWWLVLVAASVGRIWLIQRFRAVVDDRADLEDYARMFLVGVIVSAVIWSSAPYLVYPLFPMPQMLIVIVVLFGVAAGGALSLPASRWYFLVFGLILFVPLVARFIEQGELAYIVAAIAMFVLVPALYLAQLDHYEFMLKMVTLANNNADLATRLQEANIEMTVEVSRHQDYEKSVRERENSLQHLNDLVSDVESDFQYRLENVLQFGCRLFHQESGAIARIDGNRYEIWAAANAAGPARDKIGQAYDTKDTVCAHTIATTNPVCYGSPEEAGELALPDSTKDVESYMGMTLTVGGKAWGTLNFHSPHPHRGEFSPSDLDFLRLMASWIQNGLELNDWKKKSQNIEREKQIVFDALPLYVAHLDMEQQYTYVNRRYVERFTKARKAIEGQHVRDVVGEKNYQLVKPYLEAALRGEYCSFEIRPFDRNSGEPGDRSVVIQYIPNHTSDNRQDGCFALTMDVTPDEETKTMLASIAERDMLTGLVARNSFMEQLDQLLGDKRSSMQEHSLCIFDIDDFSEINARGGQLTGDDVLRQLAELARTRKRASDLLARLGSDKFALLLPDCPLSTSQGICRDFGRAVQDKEFNCGSQKIPVTISIGVIGFPGRIGDRDQLLRQADLQLKQAKKSGKNRVKAKQLDDSVAVS